MASSEPKAFQDASCAVVIPAYRHMAPTLLLAISATSPSQLGRTSALHTSGMVWGGRKTMHVTSESRPPVGRGNVARHVKIEHAEQPAVHNANIQGVFGLPHAPTATIFRLGVTINIWRLGCLASYVWNAWISLLDVWYLRSTWETGCLLSIIWPDMGKMQGCHLW